MGAAFFGSHMAYDGEVWVSLNLVKIFLSNGEKQFVVFSSREGYSGRIYIEFLTGINESRV